MGIVSSVLSPTFGTSAAQTKLFQSLKEGSANKAPAGLHWEYWEWRSPAAAGEVFPTCQHESQNVSPASATTRTSTAVPTRRCLGAVAVCSLSSPKGCCPGTLFVPLQGALRLRHPESAHGSEVGGFASRVTARVQAVKEQLLSKERN